MALTAYWLHGAQDSALLLLEKCKGVVVRGRKGDAMTCIHTYMGEATYISYRTSLFAC